MDLAQLGPSEAARLRQLNGLEPKLGISLSLLHVNMTWLLPLAAEKEKAEVVNAKNFRHYGSLYRCALAMSALNQHKHLTRHKISDGYRARSGLQVAAHHVCMLA